MIKYIKYRWRRSGKDGKNSTTGNMGWYEDKILFVFKRNMGWPKDKMLVVSINQLALNSYSEILG